MEAKMKTIMFFSVLILSLTTNNVAFGTPFDIIVPETIEIRSDGVNVGIGTASWGWIIATTDAIELHDLENVILSGTVTDQSVTVQNQNFLNESNIAPLNLDEVAGLIYSGNTNFTSFLEINETVKTVPLWQLGFSFPSMYSGNTTFTGTISVGNDTASYSTNLIFDDFSTAIFVTQGQRLSSSTTVPEPATMFLFSLGLLGLAGVNRKKTI